MPGLTCTSACDARKVPDGHDQSTGWETTGVVPVVWRGHDRAVVVSPPKLTHPADQPAEPTDYCIASAAFRLDAENHGRTLSAA